MKNANKVIEMIFDRTYSSIKENFGDAIIKEEYYTYLSKTYGRFFEEIELDEESDEKLNEIVDEYAAYEMYSWEYMSRDDLLLSMLDTDEAFEYLHLLCQQASHDAFECRRTGIYLDDMEEYKTRLNKLIQCMNDIKPRNIEEAEKCLLYGILDINFVFGKSDITSTNLYDITALKRLKDKCSD